MRKRSEILTTLREEEILLALVRDELGDDALQAAGQRESYIEWLADEARDRDRRRWTNAQLLAEADRLMARVRARQVPVKRVRERPPEHPAPLEGSPADVLEIAAARQATPVVELGVAAGAGRDLWEESCDTWLELPRALPQGRYVALRVVGDSMAPLMHTGDTVLVHVGAPVRRNNVIVARHPEDGYVCKRVSALRSRVIELSSLAAGRAPVTIPRDERLIVGTVVMVWCVHEAG